LRWWDINFDTTEDGGQEMEDLYRKVQSLAHLIQLRGFIIVTELLAIFYSLFMVDGIVNWYLRSLLLVFCIMILPFTQEKIYVKFEVTGDLMLSSVLLML